MCIRDRRGSISLRLVVFVLGLVIFSGILGGAAISKGDSLGILLQGEIFSPTRKTERLRWEAAEISASSAWRSRVKRSISSFTGQASAIVGAYCTGDAEPQFSLETQ